MIVFSQQPLLILIIVIDITVRKFRTTNFIAICLLLSKALGTGFINIPVIVSHSSWFGTSYSLITNAKDSSIHAVD
jgi:hypothetical protein